MKAKMGLVMLGVSCCTASVVSAQTTAVSTRVVRQDPSASETIKAQTERNVAAPLDAKVIALLLERFGVSAAQKRDNAASLLVPLLMSATPSRAAIGEVLREVAAVANARLPEATDALMAIATGGAPRAAEGALSDVLFTNLSTSAAQDRAIASSTIVEFPHERLSLKFVTAVAVSNAKDEKTSDTPDVFRTNTADLLAILQEGGNGVLRLALPLHRKDAENGGWYVATALDGGVMGDWLSVDSKSRFIVGGVIEVLRTLRATRPADPSERPWLHAGVRAGVRYGRKGILADVDRESLPFAQGVLEFRLPNGAVPVGISVNLVPKDFRPYARTVHLYATVSR